MGCFLICNNHKQPNYFNKFKYIMPYISIIIPAYNESERLPKSLSLIIEYMDNQNFDWEIIVVDDGSSDNTVKSVSGFKNTIVIEQIANQGKGAAVKRGMLEANGEICVFSDADLSTPIYELKKIIDNINVGYDIVIGSRGIKNELIKVHQPFYREFMGKTFNKIVQLLVLKGIKDTQCGFKGFTNKAAKSIFNLQKIKGFGFDVEILFLANRLGFKICETPVEWYNDERSKVNPITDSFKMLIEIFKVRYLHKKL